MDDDPQKVHGEPEPHEEGVDRFAYLEELGADGIDAETDRPASPRKSVFIAGLLNLFMPGAGFLYLGKSGYAVINFLILVVVCSLSFSHALAAYFGGPAPATAIGIASCIAAINEAQKLNAKPPWYEMK